MPAIIHSLCCRLSALSLFLLLRERRSVLGKLKAGQEFHITRCAVAHRIRGASPLRVRLESPPLLSELLLRFDLGLDAALIDILIARAEWLRLAACRLYVEFRRPRRCIRYAELSHQQ
jgi:hypothetical protein